MANKRDKIEERVMNGTYESAKSARTAVTRSKLHGKVKTRLHAVIDTWKDGVPLATHPKDPNAMPIQTTVSPPRTIPRLALGPSHVSTDPIDRAAMLLLKYAVIRKISMDEAFGDLRQRIDAIAIDG